MTTKRRQVYKARLRILQEAMRKGHISNAKAKQVGRFDQAYFHLNVLREAGVLEYKGFNRWVPTKRAEQRFVQL